MKNIIGLQNNYFTISNCHTSKRKEKKNREHFKTLKVPVLLKIQIVGFKKN